MKPLMIDLFCGLGGWAEGGIAEGYDVIGFDIERHVYGDEKYPAQLVLQDVITIHGKQFKNAALIVASPPCQEFSYMSMPWSISKEKQRKIEADPAEQKRLTALFDACFRIQREASEAAGHHIPMVVENVRGAQKWVGRSTWHYGSFHLWGDVPALMPITMRAQKFNPDGTNHPPGSWFAIADNKNRGSKVPGFRFDGSGKSFHTAAVEGLKTTGHVNQRDGYSHMRHLTNRAESDGVKVSLQLIGDYDMPGPGTKIGGDWFSDPNSPCRKHGSKSSARKRASAMIAKIPLTLSRHIARAYKP